MIKDLACVSNLGLNLFDTSPLVYKQLSLNYLITYSHDDLSALTKPQQDLYLFYWNRANDKLFQQAITICQHLNKKIIVLYKTRKPHIKFKNVCYLLRDNGIDTHEQILLYLRLISPKSSGTQATQKHPISIEHIPMFIEQNLDKQLREEQLAELTGYSPSYFSRLFLRTFGVHYGEYLLQVRINLAKQLLKQKEQQNVGDIAVYCGFNDASYFCKVFKREIGMSPSAFRHSNF